MSLKSSTQTPKSKKKIILFSVLGVAIIIIAIIGIFIYKKYKMYSDAEKVAKNFMTAFSEGDMSTAGGYVLPAMVESIEDSENDIVTYLELLESGYYGPRYSYSFLDYKVKSAEEYDGISFYDTYEAELKNTSSYVKPEAFARVEVEFTYNNQTDSVYLELAYCDEKFYFYNIDASEFDMELDDETSIYMTDSFANNKLTISGEPDGTRTSSDGYSVVIPDNWEKDGDNEFYLGETRICIQNTASQITNLHIGLCNEKGYFRTTYIVFEDELYKNLELGSVTTDNLPAYYAKYKFSNFDEECIDILYMKNGIVYCVEIKTTDLESASYEEALKIAGSFMFE